ncbi:MAG TPA: PQQ-binding-like beta-propeller repeat protein [Bacteroidales bacterium]
MKKTFFALILFFPAIFGFSQGDMPVVWEATLGHKIMHTGTGTEERGYSYAASDKEITFFRNIDGSTIWTKTFKEIAPNLSKIDELIPFWESNTVFLFDRKMGKDQIACVDMNTGKLLWTTDKYQDLSADNIVYIPEREGFAISMKKQIVFIKVYSGEETWSTDKFQGVVGQYVYMPDGHLVMVNFVPSTLVAMFTGFKNKIVKIDLNNGDIVWENTYIGRADRKVLTKEFVYDLAVEDNKVILRLNGFQVYDYNTGANLWSAAFDFTPEGVARKPSGTTVFGVYGAVADPVVVGNDLYVLDMSDKRHQFVKKYDKNSGKLIWTSPEIKEARAIPGMYVVGDIVVLQIGGIVEIQYKRSYKIGDVTYWEWRVGYDNVKPNGVQAFNSADGSLAWDSERFKKGITNAIMVDNDFIVCSGKALYSMDYKTGNENFEVPVAKGGVGNATAIFGFKDNVIVVGESGVSSFNPNTGDVIATGKYKDSSPEDRYGDILIMKTDKSDVAAFDLNNCSYKQFNAKKGAETSLSLDGKYAYVYETKVVTKLSTK